MISKRSRKSQQQSYGQHVEIFAVRGETKKFQPQGLQMHAVGYAAASKKDGRHGRLDGEMIATWKFCGREGDAGD